MTMAPPVEECGLSDAGVSHRICPLRALIAIYHGLLERIAESPSDVLMRRISLSTVEKIWIVLRSGAGF